MSPEYFNGTAREHHVLPSGAADDDFVYIDNGARPVINLSSEILKNGSGTASDPYHT